MTHWAAADAGAELTVEMALGVPALRRGAPQVLAGRGSLKRPIRWAHSSDVPNVPELLRGGELLLLTGMGLGRRPADQRRFVRELADRGVAALVVELGQAFRSVPPAMVEEAEARGMPLVALQHEVAFVEATEAIHSRIVSGRLAVTARAEALQAELARRTVEGAELPDVLAALAEAIGNPVLLDRAGHGVLYQARHRSPAEDVLAAWDLARGADDALADAAVGPVPAPGGRVWGRLVALPLESAVDAFDRAAVERAATLVALALLRAGQEAALAGRERGNFLADVLRGRVGAADAGARAAGLGLPGRHRRLLPVAIVAVAPEQPDLQLDDATWTEVARVIRTTLKAAGILALLGSRPEEGDALGLLGLPPGTARTAAMELLARAARTASERHLDPPGALVVVAGAAVDGWVAVPRELRRAADTAVVARAASPRGWHDASVPDVGRLLWSLREDPQLRDFVAQRLGPVLDHDRARSARLLPTLEALCAHRWHKADAARALGVNRQSLYPRLERLAKLLGADLEDPGTRLGLELAVRARAELDLAR